MTYEDREYAWIHDDIDGRVDVYAGVRTGGLQAIEQVPRGPFRKRWRAKSGEERPGTASEVLAWFISAEYAHYWNNNIVVGYIYINIKELFSLIIINTVKYPARVIISISKLIPTEVYVIPGHTYGDRCPNRSG